MDETPFRKSSVTQTGAEATRLSEPDLRAAGFSREGVVDRSGLFKGQATAAGLQGVANAVQDFGQIGLNIDEGIAKANLEGEVLDEIDAAIESRKPGFAEKQQQRLEDATLDFTVAETKRSIKDNTGAAIAASDPEFSELSDRLVAAKKTGAITAVAFELRFKEALRRAVSSRPGLINELTAHANNVLGLSGIKEKLALQEQLAQADGQDAAKRRKRAESQADQRNITFSFDEPIESLERKINKHKFDENTWEAGKRILDTNQTFSREEGLDLLRTHGDSIAGGAYNDTHNKIMGLFTEDMTPAQLTAAKITATRLGTEMKAKLGALARKHNITNEPDFKDLVANWGGAIDALTTQLGEAADGTTAAKIATNASIVVNNEWTQALFKAEINPKASAAIAPFSNMIESLGLFLREDHNQTKLVSSMTKLLTLATGSQLGGTIRSTADTRGRSDISLMIGAGVDAFLPTDTSKEARKNPNEFETMVRNTVDMFDEQIGNQPQEAFKALTETIRELSNPALRGRLLNATNQTKSDLVELGLRQASALEPDRTRFISSAREQGVNIKNRTLPDGTLQFFTDGETPKDRELLKQFNNRFTNKFNDLIKFHSVLFNIPVPETAQLLGEVYGGGSKEDILKAIDSRRKGLQEQKIPSQTKELIKSKEGFRENAYIDSSGTPTIGFGFTTLNGKPVQLGDTITKEQADTELDKQIESHSTFNNRVNVPLTPDQQAALASFEFNFGSGIWNTTGKPIIEAMNSGDLERAAEIIQRHNKIRDPNTGELKESKGLIRRRETEAKLILGEG